jgi:hypothetical protein
MKDGEVALILVRQRSGAVSQTAGGGQRMKDGEVALILVRQRSGPFPNRRRRKMDEGRGSGLNPSEAAQRPFPKPPEAQNGL